MSCAFDESESNTLGSHIYRGYDEQMMVLLMDNIKVLVDDASQSIVVVLERQVPQLVGEKGTPSPALALSAGQTVSLIQALRMALRDIEMLPPPTYQSSV